MTIHLPSELERPIYEAVRNGLFASVDEAMAEAARLLVDKLGGDLAAIPGAVEHRESSSIIGLFRDDAEFIERVTERIMEGRRTRVLRRPAHE